MDRKNHVLKYTFTVEGETEMWYLKWLEQQINATPESRYNVAIDARVAMNPLKFAKTAISFTTTSKAVHLCDYESNDKELVKKFHGVLDAMKKAKKIIGRPFQYTLGYSNFSFELWIVLHKLNCNGMLADRSQYLNYINRAFSENFASLRHFKTEQNFKACLAKLTLDDVKQAIHRAKLIMDSKEKNGIAPMEYKGYTYYRENPALSIWESIEGILKDCSIIK